MPNESPGRPLADSPAAALRGLCGGAVLLPGDSSYDTARAAWNLAVDQRPAAIAYPADQDEVAEVVRASVQVGLRVAPQGTGHNAGPLDALDGAVLLRTSGMIRVSVDATARQARAQAGARWIDAVEAAAPHGLAALHSTAGTVGIVGYSLGGGIGWYARAHGQQSTSVTAVELVTAEGELVRADADHEPDLFWALRGGGGNFGVVTALEFTLYPIREAYAGMLAWDWKQTAPVVRRWAQWATDAPDAATTTLRIQQFPADARLPAALRARRLLVIEGAIIGDGARAAALLAPLRRLRPEVDTFTTTAAPSLLRLPPDAHEPAPVVADAAILSALPPAAVDTFMAAAGPGSGSSLRLTELRQLGGALSTPHPAGGAMPNVDGQFLLYASTVADTPDAHAQGLAQARDLVAAMSRYTTGRQYLNFATRAVDVRTAYHPDAWTRLRAVRASVDPNETFLANHAVPAADAAGPANNVA